MARKLRVQYPGAIYHVMNRGDRREPIFRDEADRKRFVETLGVTCVRSDRWSRGERPRAVRPTNRFGGGGFLGRRR
jgi:hypothetical protein